MNARLETRYMGLNLRSPVVVSSCTLSDKVDNIVRMEEGGAGAVVLYSLFEEQIRQDEALRGHVRLAGSAASAGRPGPTGEAPAYRSAPVEYLDLIRRAKERVDMPVIASLNGVTPEGWINYALEMQAAGADGIELNLFFIPADTNMTSVEVEQRYLRIAHQVSATVDIPVAMKINPFLTAAGHVAKEMTRAGADALVLFNRLYQPDFDIERMTLTSDMTLSEPNEIRLPLLWIAALHGRIDASLAASTGVQGGREVIKYLLAGADVVMSASALYQHGIDHIKTMIAELESWMERKQFASVDAFRGFLSQRNIADTTGYGRAHYIRILEKAKSG